MTEGVTRRHSTGTVASKSPAFPSGNQKKIQPRYLRASTGSCHDFCKYGRKQENGDKEKYDPRSSENKAVPCKKEGSPRAVVNIERRKKTPSQQRDTSRTKLKSSGGTNALERKSSTPTGLIGSVKKKDNKVKNSQLSFSNTKSSKLCGIAERNDSYCVEEVKSVQGVQIIDRNFPPVQQNEPSENDCDHRLSEPPKATNALSDSFSSPYESDLLQQFEADKVEPAFDGTIQLVDKVVPERPHETINQLPPLSSPIKDVLPDQVETIKPETMPVCELVPIKYSNTDMENASSVKRIIPSAEPKQRKESWPVSKKAVPSVKHRVNMEKTVTGKTSPKIVASVESAAMKLMPHIASSSPTIVLGIPAGKAKGKSNLTKRGIPAGTEVKKGVRLPMLTSPKRPTERGSSQKSRSCRDGNSFSLSENRKKIGKGKGSDEDVMEKTASDIDPKEESVNSCSVHPMGRRSVPMPSSSSSSSSSDNGKEGIVNCGTDGNEPDDDQAEALNENGKEKMPKRAARIHSQEKDVEARKLEFRRGKVVNPQPASVGPRKLRFRRGRELDGKRDGKGKKAFAHNKRFRRKDTIDCGLKHDEPTEIVALKHQEQDKKDAQGLFNEVIEVTASKLVETRKSKVKALVGAFETVISLQ